MKLFAEDEFDCNDKAVNLKGEYAEYLEPLYEIIKEHKSAICFLPLYPLGAIKEFLKYLVCYKDVSVVGARSFSEKYLEDCTCPMGRLLENWSPEKYFQMLSELKILASSVDN